MARVQGTVVGIAMTFDEAPPDVQVAVQPPGNLALVVAKLSSGQVKPSTDPAAAPNTYLYSIDTTPGFGYWRYEVASLGGLTNVRRQRGFDVRQAIGPFSTTVAVQLAATAIVATTHATAVVTHP